MSYKQDIRRLNDALECGEIGEDEYEEIMQEMDDAYDSYFYDQAMDYCENR